MKITFDIPDNTRTVFFNYVVFDIPTNGFVGCSVFDTKDLKDGAELKIPREDTKGKEE